jgi:hypothetical protein
MYSKRDQHVSASLCFTSPNDRDGQSVIEWRKLKERGVRVRETFIFLPCALCEHEPKIRVLPLQPRNLYANMFGPFGLAAWPAKESGGLFGGCKQLARFKLDDRSAGPVYLASRNATTHTVPRRLSGFRLVMRTGLK